MTDTLAVLKASVADHYEIERELGRGGMATVYLALDRRHNRHVALKVLNGDLVAATGADRFLREIDIAAALTHPNIVALLDSGAAAGTPYFTMPYLDGGSLRARLDREHELPIAVTTRIVADVVEALRHAHAAGIVHRDIKPENILFSAGRAQVADFGVAKAIANASAPRLTGTGLAVGTPAYMAPEQAVADPTVDRRADIYALGVIWYEMLTGHPVFAGLSPQQQIAAHIMRVPDPPIQTRPGLPRVLSDMVMRCLEKRPSDRWQTADELAQAIAGFEGGAAAASHGSSDAPPVLRTFTITEELSQQISGEAFDPRLIGDEIQYLDNGHVSDTLVVYLTRWCIDPSDGSDFLRQTPYHAIAPALFGFTTGRRYRVSVPIDDHLVLLGGLVRALVATTGARQVILVGFSSGGDLALRFAAKDPATNGAPIDAALVFGANLAVETAFLSAELARADTGREDALLPFLVRVNAGATSLQEWLDVNEYLVRLIKRFRTDMPILKAFAEQVVAPFTEARLAPFIAWYLQSTRLGRRVRCVFEDSDVYRRLVRELQVGQRDAGILGPRYQPGSLVIEPGTGHFDLESPAMIARHLDPLVDALRSGAESGALRASGKY